MLDLGLGLMGLQGISEFTTQNANARAMDRQAAAERKANRANEEMERERIAALLGSQRAEAGGKGLTLRGSPMEILLETRRNYARDARLRAYNSEVRARQAESQADIYRRQAAGGLLGTAASGLLTYERLK